MTSCASASTGPCDSLPRMKLRATAITLILVGMSFAVEARSKDKRPEEILIGLADEGVVRRATQADIDAWVDGVRKTDPKVKSDADKVHPSMRLERTWVVLGAIRLPKGLHGSKAQDFIVPGSVPRPKGDSGHGSLYFMKDFTCTGRISDPENRSGIVTSRTSFGPIR